MTPIRLERLNEGHLDAVLEIERSSNPAPWSEASFRGELTNPQSVFLVALKGVQVVGFGGAWMVIDEAHITTVAVHPEFRREGIGRLLMVELLKRTQALGMTCSTLEVRAGNTAAIRLYEQLGYVSVSTRKGYYPNNREDAVVMWLYGLERWMPSLP